MVPLFVDNDVIKKLAALDLLDIALEVLGYSVADVYVLGTASYKFETRNPTKGVKKYGAITHPRIAAFLAQAQAVTDQFDQGLHDQLATVEGVDGGEAILLSAAASNDGALLTTGDKRCLNAFAGAKDCAAVAAKLAGRVICVEQLVLRAISHTGFDEVLARAAPGLPELQDTALNVVFGSGAQTQRRNAEDALTSYVSELRGTTGALLIL